MWEFSSSDSARENWAWRQLRVASRHSTASWRFFLLPVYFFFLSQSAPDAFFSRQFDTHLKLFFLSYQTGRENCSADLFSFVSPFPEANRSLIVKFRLGPVHHFSCIKRVKPPTRKKNIVPLLYGCKTIKSPRRSSNRKKGSSILNKMLMPMNEHDWRDYREDPGYILE